MKRNFFILLLFFSFTSKAQQIQLLILASDSLYRNETRTAIESIRIEKKLLDTSSVVRDRALREVLLSLYEKGFLTASFDSVSKDSIRVLAYLSLGLKYVWANVSRGNVDEAFISYSGFKEKIFTDRPVQFSRLARFQVAIVRACENNGYPFASIRLDSAQVQGDSISGNLRLDKGPFILIDSIAIRGTADISDVYIRNYIGIKRGDVYNENLIRQIKNRLKEIPFVVESKAMQAEFTEKDCKLILTLAKKKASQINGVIGIAPDELNPGKLFFTGEFLLKLANPFGNGEVVEVNWKSPGRKTQDLKTRLVYPFVVGRFGLDLGFSIYKKDTTYIDVIKDLGIQYLLPRGNYLKAYVNNKTSSLQSVEGLENITILPTYADINTTLYGLGIRSEKLDYRINPQKGTAIEAGAATGTRVIERNPKINAVVYDSIDLKTVQYHGSYTIDRYFRLRSRTVLNLGIKGVHLINSQIFQNELFRLGGLRTLRGFDEESIYASTYDILKVELRYLLEENSYFALFWNGAYYENHAYNFRGKRSDFPYGFGAGVSFDTRLGIFAISYALGSQFGNPIEIRQGKVHFGLINNF